MQGELVYEVCKPIRVAGVDYNKGDLIDVSEWAEHKIGQMLNQRFIRPVA